MEKEIKPPRPLTHDLFKSFANRFNIKIKQVIIHKLIDGVFYSSLICERDKIEEIIDARTSDAIALATRFNAPIFTYENILDKAGIYLKVKEDPKLTQARIEVEEMALDLTKDSSLNDIPLGELNKQLIEAVENEDYELAAKIRDEISKRKK